MKRTKSGRKAAHTPKKQLGMGDYYGSGVRAKVGKVRDVFGVDKPTSKKTGKPPRSLA